jgi:deazaflavin-dependent oxidoreductase (nitroreductase family)
MATRRFGAPTGVPVAWASESRTCSRLADVVDRIRLVARHHPAYARVDANMSPYKRIWRRVGHTRWFAFVTRYVVAPFDRRLYQLSRGRISAAGPPLFSWLLITTTGRKSGQPRTTPLVYVRDGDRLVVTSENFGMAERPAGWRLNLQAKPEATVQIGSTRAQYRARLASDDETARYWPRLLQEWPALETYRRRSGVRYVFVLEPLSDAAFATDGSPAQEATQGRETPHRGAGPPGDGNAT